MMERKIEREIKIVTMMMSRRIMKHREEKMPRKSKIKRKKKDS